MIRPSLVTLVRRQLEGETLAPTLRHAKTILVATSGGPDSMALLSVLVQLAPKLGLRLVAHGVDHGLRREAQSELDEVAHYAASVNTPFDRTVLDLARGGNLQARARRARWQALCRAARTHGATVLATAHHADDRAETFLLRLLRGAGLRGLGVLPAQARAPEDAELVVVRPMLTARRADVLLHLRRHGVPFATDPSNDDLRFARTQVRRRVMPLLAELDPRVVDHLGSLAEEASAETRSDGPARTVNGWITCLPRPTQEALARLVTHGSTAERVWLPGGFVVSLDPRARRPSKTPGARESPLERGAGKRQPR